MWAVFVSHNKFVLQSGSNSYYRGSQISRPQCVHIVAVAVCRLYGESKSAGGIQDEHSEGLSASWGREHLVDLKQSNKYT